MGVEELFCMKIFSVLLFTSRWTVLSGIFLMLWVGVNLIFSCVTVQLLLWHQFKIIFPCSVELFFRKSADCVQKDFSGLFYTILLFVCPCARAPLSLLPYFSSSPGTRWVQTFSEGLWGQKYFHSNNKMLLALFTLTPSQWYSRFSRGCMTCGTEIDWIQMQVWESRCLLLCQILRRCIET